MRKYSLLGVIDEDPFDPQTWSGSSAYFFSALKKQGVLHAAIAATPSKTSQWIYKALSFQVGLDKWKFKYQINPGFYQQMTRTARNALENYDSSQFDVILQVGAWYDMTGYRNKKVISYHDGNLATMLASPYGYPKISENFIRKVLAYERDLYGRLDIIFTMSRWLADSFVRDFGVRPVKVFPIGAGINLPRTDEILGKKYERPNFLFVGKKFERKGGETLLKAFQLVREEVKNAELTLIGPELVSPPSGVRCLGFISKFTDEGIDNLLKEYQRASVFVLPSLYEPFGISFVEAMAHRLPCIGTSICAMPEIIQHDKTGYVVPPGDHEALARFMLTLAKEPARCKEFGDAGYLHYRQNYTWEAVTTRMCSILSDEL